MLKGRIEAEIYQALLSQLAIIEKTYSVKCVVKTKIAQCANVILIPIHANPSHRFGSSLLVNANAHWGLLKIPKL